LLRQVSCYTLLSGFQLPWPPSCCLEQPTPFVGSDERRLWHLNLTARSVHPASPVLLTKNGPLGTRIHCPASIKQVGLLTNLKFENRLRLF
ncbi:predicted protein, partial [Nematostella vectensis]